jgi:hypothetical protein
MNKQTATASVNFPFDVNQQITHEARITAAAVRTRDEERRRAELTKLRGNLILAWRNLVEETSISESLEVIAADIHNLAEEFGKFSQQERFILAAELFTLSEAAGKACL